MKPLPLLLRVQLTVTLLAGAAAAQQPAPGRPVLVPPPAFAPVEGDLRATILSANRAMASAPQWGALLSAPPIADLLDALVPLRGALPGYGEQQVRRALAARRDDVEKAWRDEPRMRQERAAAFALCDLGWPTRFAAGDEAERQDVLAVAAWLLPEAFESALRIDDVGVRPAAERLASAAAEGQRARGQHFRDALAAVDWNLELHLLLNIAREQLSAFAIVDGLLAADPRARARAMLALRRLRSLPLPDGVAAALSTEPIEPLRALVGVMSPEHAGLQDGEVDAVLAAIRAGGPLPWLRLLDVRRVSPERRRQLAEALLTDLGEVHLYPSMLQRDRALAFELFPNLGLPRPVAQVAAAASIGREQFDLVLQRLAAAAPKERGALLAGLYKAYGPGLDRDDACAKVLVPLLDERDADLAVFAGVFAGLLLEHSRFPQLAQRLGDRALAALAGDEPLGFEMHDPGFIMAPPSMGAPANPASWWVWLAAKAQDERLLEPLIARLPDADGITAWDGRMWFTCRCLSMLVPKMDGAAARRAHDKVVPLTRLQQRGIRGESLPPQVLWARLLAAVPDEVVESYATATELLQSLRHDLGDLEERMAAARARLVWPERDPLALTGAWSEGGEPRNKAVAAVYGWWMDRPGHVLRLVAEGALPKALAASALPDTVPLDLAQLAGLLSEDDALIGDKADAFARRVARAAASRVQELELLPHFAASRAVSVARAAALRAHRLGDPGVPIVASVIDRWAAGDVQLIAWAASLALDLGVPPGDVQALAARIQREAEFTNQATSLLVRFGGLAILDVPDADRRNAALGSRADFDAATWRSVLGAAMPWALRGVLGGPNLGPEGSTANALAALELVAELPRWDNFTEGAVIHRTLDPDPRVRLAAYRALHSRDRNLWACAWLAYEAEFDADPDVRAYAAKLPR
ncbi:MAG: hypothetical protein H6838_15840 [Planctomycetes bacterium]|nr:hypothetical protein [Planctomycetota bacterium]